MYIKEWMKTKYRGRRVNHIGKPKEEWLTSDNEIKDKIVQLHRILRN